MSRLSPTGSISLKSSARKPEPAVPRRHSRVGVPGLPWTREEGYSELPAGDVGLHQDRLSQRFQEVCSDTIGLLVGLDKADAAAHVLEGRFQHQRGLQPGAEVSMFSR